MTDLLDLIEPCHACRTLRAQGRPINKVRCTKLWFPEDHHADSWCECGPDRCDRRNGGDLNLS